MGGGSNIISDRTASSGVHIHTPHAHVDLNRSFSGPRECSGDNVNLAGNADSYDTLQVNVSVADIDSALATDLISCKRQGAASEIDLHIRCRGRNLYRHFGLHRPGRFRHVPA